MNWLCRASLSSSAQPFPCEWPHLTCFILWPLSGHGSILRTAYHLLLRPYLAVAALLPIFRLEQHPSVLTAKLSTERLERRWSRRRIFSQSWFSPIWSRAEQVGESWTKHTAPILSDDPPLISWSFSLDLIQVYNKQTNKICRCIETAITMEWVAHFCSRDFTHIYGEFLNVCAVVTPGGKLLHTGDSLLVAKAGAGDSQLAGTHPSGGFLVACSSAQGCSWVKGELSKHLKGRSVPRVRHVF